MAEELDPEVDGFVIAWEREQRRLRKTPGTVEWAQAVELPSFLHPLKRIGTLRAHAAQLALSSDLPDRSGWVFSRFQLVQLAEFGESISEIRSLRDSVSGLKGATDDLRDSVSGGLTGAVAGLHEEVQGLATDLTDFRSEVRQALTDSSDAVVAALEEGSKEMREVQERNDPRSQ